MTIQTKVTNLTRKQATILATVSVVLALRDGVDPSLYMLMDWLYNFLVKSNTLPLDLRNKYEQRACMLLELICSWVNGDWMTMSGREKLPPNVIEKIPPDWLPNSQTWGSWHQAYDVGKFFRIRIVPLDVLIESRASDTERYSSYTKGYGNGGHRSRTLKTPYDSEIDGEDTDRDPPEIPLEDFQTYSTILLEIESAKIQKKNRK
jgi:hypothetical protein